jgi:hypothetical protein
VGGSIFTTSAPQSARIAPADGPATHSPSSTTRIPVNGPDMTFLSQGATGSTARRKNLPLECATRAPS